MQKLCVVYSWERFEILFIWLAWKILKQNKFFFLVMFAVAEVRAPLKPDSHRGY